MNKILVLCQNPKTEENVKNPLVGTRSYETFKSWCEEANIPLDRLEFKNTFDDVGDRIYSDKEIAQRALEEEFKERVKGYLTIICLGKVADKVVTRHITYTIGSVLMGRPTYPRSPITYSLPHPSGLNRILNNPEARQNVILNLSLAYAEWLVIQTKVIYA